MQYTVSNIKLKLNYTEADLVKYFKSNPFLLDLSPENITVIRRSIDSRSNTNQPFYVISAAITTDKKLSSLPNIKPFEGFNKIHIANLSKKIKYNPVVIGAGPAGLMAALILSEANTDPIVVEQGEESAKRNITVADFWDKKILNPLSNVLFGEGGAGMFSDGKLTSRSKEKPLIRYFFEKLIEAGAPSSIMYESFPHLGSDLMLKIIPNIRQMIINNGGSFLFGHKLTDIRTDNNKISAVILNKEKKIKTEALFLATGHSSRNIYHILEEHSVDMKQKPFAMGVRIEMPQAKIDLSQNGKWANTKELQKASFRLTRKGQGPRRDCYSFCMCPGGEVITCASDRNEVFTNGMSLSDRNLKYGNAAFLVPVTPGDYKNDKNLTAPINLQKSLEQKAFEVSGNYLMPAQTLVSFLENKDQCDMPKHLQTKAVPCNLKNILPDFITYTLKKSIPAMLSKLNAVDMKECMIYGPETRSSSPLTITRNKDDLQSTNTLGLYPCGEGSGFAGGIVSSAIDGIKAAVSYTKNYSE